MRHFSVLPNLLPENDPRYKKWKKSLKKRPAPWNKGFTKNTHPSVAKISKTFKKKKIDNFARWRRKMKQIGKWPSYSPFPKTEDLAELVGVILGDGNIYKHPGTEELRISSNSEDKGFIKRYEKLVYKIFKKKPKLVKDKDCNGIRIRIYQKDISKRLGILTGVRKEQKIRIPQWVLKSKKYLIRYLRGLYEAEGSFSIHEPTYTYKFLFTNKNSSLLNNTYRALKILGFHPYKNKDRIQISRKEEVYKIKDLIRFRQY